MTLSPLPPHWVVRVSRAKGKVYYYHEPTQTTQWVRPASTSTQGHHKRFKRDDADDRTEPTLGEHHNNREYSTIQEHHTEREHQTNQEHQTEQEHVLETIVRASMRVGGSSFNQSKCSKQSNAKVLFRPWPHQVTAVTSVLSAIQAQNKDNKEQETGRESSRFLVQHSTGAGKTLTIAALAHQLLSVKDVQCLQFHTVVVMLDRVKLNEQVGDAVERYLRQNGVFDVFRASSIDHLAAVLDVSTQQNQQQQQQQSLQRVIITTIQKMALLVKDDVLVTRLLHRSLTRAGKSQDEMEDKFQRVAIITDEAHRSHTSSTRDAIEKVMKAGEGSYAQLTVRPIRLPFLSL